MSAETEDQLAGGLTTYEQKILAFWEGNTFRGVRDPAYNDLVYRDRSGKEYDFDLVAEITGKVCGDVGSGGGGLGTTAALEEIKTEVWSIHPNMGDEGFIEWQRNQSLAELQRQYPSSSLEDIAKAQKTYESRTIRGFAHKLHAVPDESFDVLVDSYAVHQYMSRKPGIYEASIRELLRVLRPGGRIIVLGGLSPLVSDQPTMPSSDFRERTLRQLGVAFMPLYKKTPYKDKGSVGAIIQKSL